MSGDPREGSGESMDGAGDSKEGSTGGDFWGKPCTRDLQGRIFGRIQAQEGFWGSTGGGVKDLQGGHKGIRRRRSNWICERNLK